MSTRIGVVSDTHLYQVSKGLRDIFDIYLSDVDMIFHVGDVVSPQVVEFLKQKPFYGVCGNMDPVEVKNILPFKQVVEVEGFRIGLIHGWGPSAGLEERIVGEFNDVDAIVYGHSHRPLNEYREGILLFNPGTATGYSSKGPHSIGILEVDKVITGKIIHVEELL